MKDIKEYYWEDLQIVIYYNDSLKGINTTYDKLFLMGVYNKYNVSTSNGMGIGYNNYAFYDGDPHNLLSEIFKDKQNYPENAEKALKNRKINIIITKGKEMTYEDFKENFKNSFTDGFNTFQ